MVIPLGDENPTHAKPIVSIAILIICCLVFLWQFSLGSDGGKAIYALGVIPASLIQGIELPAEIQLTIQNLLLTVLKLVQVNIHSN